MSASDIRSAIASTGLDLKKNPAKWSKFGDDLSKNAEPLSPLGVGRSGGDQLG